MTMKLNPQPTFLMPDMAAGSLPPDAENFSVRRPQIRCVVAENHAIELQDGDPALDDLVKLIGHQGMKEFGRFVGGGFRMTELLGLIDDEDDQIPQHVVDDLKPHVSVLPLVSPETKLMANALVAVALRALGATIEGPYEQPVFLRSPISTSSKILAWKLFSVPGVSEVLDEDLWWAEVPPIDLDISDPDNEWEGLIPNPGYVVGLFLSGY